MALVATLVFGLLALVFLGNSWGAFANRHAVAAAMRREPIEPIGGWMWRGVLVSGVPGLSFLLASVLVGWNGPIALVFGLWPILLFAILFATGHITVISRLSTGE